nr:unnamed protein product [Callosobruchus analis]
MKEGCEEQRGTCDPFKRKELVKRSPPKRGPFSLVEGKLSTSRRKPETTTIRTDLETEKAGAGTKRRREESEEAQEKMTGELQGMLKKHEDTAKALMGVVKTIPNTKCEIKRGISELVHQAEAANRKYEEIEAHPREVKAPKVTVSREVSSVGTQTEQKSAEENVQHKAAEIRKAIEEGSCFEDLGKLLDTEWPDEAFQKVKLVDENACELSKKSNTVVKLDPKQEGKGVIKSLYERYFDSKDLL